MNHLKNKIMLAGLKSYPALSSFKICDKIRPYLRQFNLSLAKNQIVLPEKRSKEQEAICHLNAPDCYMHVIPFDQILWTEERREGLHLYLRTGHVFFFPREGKVWQISNLYGYGKPSLITVWWWTFTGGVASVFKKLRTWFRGAAGSSKCFLVFPLYLLFLK